MDTGFKPKSMRVKIQAISTLGVILTPCQIGNFHCNKAIFSFILLKIKFPNLLYSTFFQEITFWVIFVWFVIF